MIYDLMSNHPMNVGRYNTGWGKATEHKDEALLNKLCDYFLKRTETDPVSYENSVWSGIIERQSGVITALQERNLDYLHSTFRNLFSSTLTHGTAQGDDHYRSLSSNENMRKDVAQIYYDKLITLMEMTGIVPMFSPEEYYFVKRFDQYFQNSPEFYLEALMKKYNFDATAPKYSGNLFGLSTHYGLYNERDFMSLGVALSVREKFDNSNITICEIGGGVGHLAYYLYRLGFKNITIVDLPTISLSQMYFLSTNIEQQDAVNLISPKEFTGEYDLVINVDSMTEMSIDSASEYCDKMLLNTKNFISINHETNPFTVSSICKMKKTSRNIFWLRKGYVTEEYEGLSQ